MRYKVLDVQISILTVAEAIDSVLRLAHDGAKSAICTFVNVHMAVEARRSARLRQTLATTEMNFADGKPIYALGRLLHGRNVDQISGPDFILEFCADPRSRTYSHFIYGGAPGVAQRAAETLRRSFPGTSVVGVYSPPYSDALAFEDFHGCQMINASKADIVWVCLGCPKQELWMYSNQKYLDANVLLGVGQAIDILADRITRAPYILRKLGLEWAYRLIQEPRRMWRRYLMTNSLFLIYLLTDVCKNIKWFRRVDSPM